MKSIRSHCAVLMLALLSLGTHSKGADIHYVSSTNTSPSAPFLTWATAATNIQDALDVAANGDTVLVTNGIYATGGRVVYGAMTNRVVVDKAVVVRSVNGPEVTVISGQSATRCVYLTNGTVLSGFTLTNGRTCVSGDYYQELSGGGVWCASTNAVVTNCTLAGNWAGPNFGDGEGGGAVGCTLNNCTLTNNWAGDAGGGASWSTLNNCTLTGNTAGIGSGASTGGGACGCTLNNCTLTGNWAFDGYGGGASSGLLNNCTLTGNWAGSGGGGVYNGILNNCTLVGNSADAGGGACGTLNNCTLRGNRADVLGGGATGTLNNCTLTGNTASEGGGAVGTLNNCTLVGNSADAGGGVSWSTLNNCTLTGNYARYYGGGEHAGTLTNCILYGNTAGNSEPNYYGGTLNYCCTTPLPTDGVGNIEQEPLFVDLAGGDYHLQPGSPCIDAGTDLSALISTDLEGKPRPLDGDGDGIAAFDMGAYEFGIATPSDLVEALTREVAQSSLPDNRTRPLLASLQAADGSFGRGNLKAGINQLRAFQQKVGAQVARDDAALAEQWIAAAERIIRSVLGGV